MSDWRSFMTGWHGFTETVFGFFDLSQTHHEDFMASISEVNAKLDKLAVDVAALVSKAASEQAAIDAQKAADAVAQAAELDAVGAKIDAISTVVAPAPVV